MKEFIEAIDGLLAAWVDYQEDKETFWEAIDKLRATLPTKAVSKANFRLHLAAVKFIEEVDSYDGREAEMIGTPPHNAFWTALIKVESARKHKEAEPPRPESVAMLHAQNVPQAQICLIWGFMDEEGRPQLDLYEKELNKAGSVIGKDYVWPSLASHRETVARDFAAYKKEIGASLRADKAQAACPETPQELFEQGVSDKQAALMLGLKIEDVQLLYEKFESDGIAPRSAAVVTKDGVDMSEYDPTAHTPVDTSRPLSADELAVAEYAELDRAELEELCASSELSTEGEDDELRERLARQDAAIVEAV